MTPTDAPPGDLTLRLAEPADLAAVAEVYLSARATAEASGVMPLGVPGAAEVRRWVLGWDLARDQVWLAVAGPDVLGFARLTGGWLDDLYVRPEAQGRGVGGALVELSQALYPDGLGLWVFESNLPARRFYARHGFVEGEPTDGSENEEGAPDIELTWRPA